MENRLIYVSDRGDRYVVSSMETSHLINVIRHHQGQCETLHKLPIHTNIRRRIQALDETIKLLSAELLERKVEPDEYIQEDNDEF
jgi:hypothetical protein